MVQAAETRLRDLHASRVVHAEVEEVDRRGGGDCRGEVVREEVPLQLFEARRARQSFFQVALQAEGAEVRDQCQVLAGG